VDEAFIGRVARNQALLRETNEAIARGQWPGESNQVVRFRCECPRLDCGEAVEMTLEAYEQIRAHPRWFVVADGHVVPEAEGVVAEAARYLIVEKTGAAGELAGRAIPGTDRRARVRARRSSGPRSHLRHGRAA